ncbi:hypothetical protein [Aliikangiella maris]|uniref:EexN family lipoprotein n=2 Tax=Aliikangiella maris TaxID=3162458 RepID=A0ABV2BX71_9GAMM
MIKKLAVTLLILGLSACAKNGTPLDFMRGLFGYTPPPEETTISEELKLEYQRCKKVGVDKNCAQAAYDVVRKVKGLEPRTIPKGVVIILEGDGGHGEQEEEQSAPELQQKK